mmetsp:Transcript_31820/g.74339  ORF Transcript_31820/g.74339 Transcript_31820/m.74339 type:complete len:246 (-) Transcript_31820:1611-2348(-)
MQPSTDLNQGLVGGLPSQGRSKAVTKPPLEVVQLPLVWPCIVLRPAIKSNSLAANINIEWRLLCGQKVPQQHAQTIQIAVARDQNATQCLWWCCSRIANEGIWVIPALVHADACWLLNLLNKLCKRQGMRIALTCRKAAGVHIPSADLLQLWTGHCSSTRLLKDDCITEVNDSCDSCAVHTYIARRQVPMHNIQQPEVRKRLAHALDYFNALSEGKLAGTLQGYPSILVHEHLRQCLALLMADIC